MKRQKAQPGDSGLIGERNEREDCGILQPECTYNHEHIFQVARKDVVYMGIPGKPT